MSAQITAARTPAETALAETFDAAVSRLPGGADVKKLREAAFSAFYTAGLPHRRIEALALYRSARSDARRFAARGSAERGGDRGLARRIVEICASAASRHR
ncbi:FeS assembly protein SufD (fragment) [Methylocella tundrae]|uniref:FeS assembly protein SufD n=1 Tax=Methylocella tundrae TaxID=227605 RepID=A0A4U8Z4H9_METTU